MLPAVLRSVQRRRHSAQLLILVAPFVVAIAALKGLTIQIHSFHYTDEHAYHLPTIRQFATDWPITDLTHYPAAQTPLYHWLMAGVVKLFGFHVWLLRLLSAAFSYAAVVVVFRLLLRRGARAWTACGLALLFALSPYVFGVSFLAMTDGLALLFVVLALSQLDAFRSSQDARSFAAFLLWLALAVLTRQSALWLAAAGLAVVAIQLRSWRPVALAAIGTALSLLPLVLLVAAWGGLVPRGSDPTSCGLCRAEGSSVALTLRPGLFTLAILAIYAAAVLGPSLLSQSKRAPAVLLGLITALGAATLLALEPLQRTSARDAGYLWRLASHIPEVAGASLIFWFLVPVGALLGVYLAKRSLPDELPAVIGCAFLVSTLVVRLPYQKYFDPFALLFVLLAFESSRDLRRRSEWVPAACLMLGFVAYVLTF